MMIYNKQFFILLDRDLPPSLRLIQPHKYLCLLTSGIHIPDCLGLTLAISGFRLSKPL
jgi:hypothetical protein